MLITGRRRKIVFFVVLGVCLVVLAVALNVSWIILHWRQGLLLFVGVLFFAAIILGLILNTGFLVREIRLNEQHDSFINAVTHELKTPITSIRLYLETLQRRDVDETQRQHFYQLMLDDTDRLRGTVDQVLKAGEVRFRRTAARNPVEVDFPVIVGECMELARTRHHLQPAALYWQDTPPQNGHGGGAAIKVLGDADELRTAIANILDNAIKYSGAEVDVSVGIDTPDPQRVVLRVRDRGVGIPAGELKRIFKRFYRVPRSRSSSHAKGTGLGLFIVRAIARAHGGKVFAESAGAARGTTVTLELPRSAA
ncbi:MAG: HAMP domain-containing sensor histidine kinase [Candidatus Acidiferrales bacterium]